MTTEFVESSHGNTRTHGCSTHACARTNQLACHRRAPSPSCPLAKCTTTHNQQPFSRDYDDEKKSSKKYLPTIDFLLHQTFSFSAGPPTIGWKGLEQDAAMKPYVPMLKRLLDCDYKSRARINEAVLLTQQLPGGETFPQDTR